MMQHSSAAHDDYTVLHSVIPVCMYKRIEESKLKNYVQGPASASSGTQSMNPASKQIV